MSRLPVRIRSALRVAGVLALGFVALAAMPAGEGLRAGPDAVRIDDFDRDWPPNGLPDGWELHKIAPFFGNGKDLFFQLRKAGSEYTVHMRSGSDNSYTLGSSKDFRLQDWPVLEWEWKVVITPKGGDVRVKDRDDQAGSICVIVNPGLVGFDSLCYLWENDGPKDTPIKSTKRDASRYLILRTVKEDGTGKWYSEKRDMLADYVRVFGKQPQDTAVIGMQIDSDSTASKAEVFYRNIYRRKR